MHTIRKLFFYHDAAEYGGHEMMALEAVRYLAANKKATVSFAFSQTNDRLFQELTKINDTCGPIDLYPLKFRSRSLQPLRTLTSPAKVESIAKLIRHVNPAAVLVVQGRIEISSLGLLAAKTAGFYTISYIPMAHEISVSGRRLFVESRERLNRYFYALPDKILTISESARQMLLARGAKAPIVVVRNGVQKRTFQNGGREKFRRTNRVEDGDYLVAVIGRIDFSQKGQDFAVQSISQFRNELGNCKFLFVGSGPDRQRLVSMIEASGLQKWVRLLPWTDNPAEIYAGVDMLLIPSKFEGVPLVMLEAMLYKKPIVASNTDGMAELLPRSWLFPYGDCKALVDAVARVRRSDTLALVEMNYNRISSEFMMSEFCATFSSAILG
jgi:glycosyltransferase involved in cell wall biosynthesis